MVVHYDGEYMPKHDVRISPDDRGFLFGDGIYEVIPCYDGRFLGLDAHMARMANGLAEIGIEGVDVDAMAELAHELIVRNDAARGRWIVYQQVTRGVAPRRHAFPNPPVSPTIYAYATPFSLKSDPARGERVITIPDLRWSRCHIKSISLLGNCLANQQAMEAGVYEAVQVRDGRITEGSHSGVFAVFDGVAVTPPKSNYILPSITRDIVLDICAEIGIPSREEEIELSRFRSADEVFMVGGTTEVLPIVEIDGQRVAGGTPGPVSRKLAEHFTERTRTGEAFRRRVTT